MAGTPQKLTQADLGWRNYVFSKLGCTKPIALSEVLNDLPIQKDDQVVVQQDKRAEVESSTIEPTSNKTEDDIPIHSRTRRNRRTTNRKTSKYRRSQGPGC